MPEITKTKNRRPKTEKITWLLFALVIASVYFFALGSIPLVGPDEPRYAQVAREMFERGDWVTPTLGGANWFEKPALLYWLQITFYKIFGVSEFAARFGSALFGLGTIFSLWLLGRQWREALVGGRWSIETTTNDGQRATNEFANWLALIAASSIGLLAFSRGASFDIILTFPMTASLCCYFLFETFLQKHYFSETPKHIIVSQPKFKIISATPPIVFAYLLLAGFYFFIGLAILAKGLVGIVFPIAIVFFYHIIKFELLPSPKFLISLLWGTILSLLVAATWYLPMYLAHGWTFVDEFFVQHHFQRFTSDKYQHHQPFWFFFLVLPLMTLPWLPFFLAAIWNFFKGFFQRNDDRKSLAARHSPLTIFAFAWLIVPLCFFSFSGSKLPGYILPALPAALILTTISVFSFVQKSKRRRTPMQILAFLVFAIVALLLHFVVPEFARQDSVKNLIETTNAKGYTTQKIVNLYTVSHNAEFYACGRLVRASDGKLKRYDDFSVLIKDLERADEPEILVLMSHGVVQEIIGNEWVETEVLADNGETAIVFVKFKN